MSFQTHGNILEHVTINTDMMEESSAIATSLYRYNMTDYDKAVFSVGIYASARSSVGGFIGQATVWVKESSDSTGALSALATLDSTAMPGQKTATILTNAKTFDLVIANEIVEGDVVIVNGVSFIHTTVAANLAASAASGHYFGVAGGASDGGGSAVLESFATMLRNTTYGLPGVVSANYNQITTLVLELSIEDTASTYFTVQTTGGIMSAWFVYGEAHIEVHADDMTTGEKFLSLAVSTQDRAVSKIITVVRTGRRAGGVADHHHGQYIKST